MVSGVKMEIPQPLIDDIGAGKCLPFVGAGFSLNATLPPGKQMPDWGMLTEYLAEITHVPAELGGLKIASAFEKKFGRVQLIEAIRKALNIGYIKPGEAHKSFVDLPFDTIYTTNFDLLLEDAFTNIHKPFRSLVGDKQISFHGGPFDINIIKMHGDLRHEEYIVITYEDYKNYLDNYPVIATHLSASLITRTPLFIGYSFSDPDFENIRRVIKERLGKFERMAYVVDLSKKSDEIEAKLGDNFNVISISADSNKEKDAKLAELFKAILQKLDIQEGASFRAKRPEAFEDISAETFAAASRSEDASPILSSYSNLCFVIMPYLPEFNLVYSDFIKPIAERSGLTVLRADEMATTGSTIEKVRTAIMQSRLCIADLSGQNPNVIYELSLAQHLNKPIILVAKDKSDHFFDLISSRLVLYDVNELEKAGEALEDAIQRTLSSDRLAEAKKLIDSGMYRAAAATLGVIMEYGLRQLMDKQTDSIMACARQKGYVSTSQMIKELYGQRIIRADDKANLSKAHLTRNKAAHELRDPSRDEVEFMFEIIKKFKDDYNV
jgi:hypothetical protein